VIPWFGKQIEVGVSLLCGVLEERLECAELYAGHGLKYANKLHNQYLSLYITWFTSERPTQGSAPPNTSAAHAQQPSAIPQRIAILYVTT
jgi:hypothetical protein